MIIQLLDKLLTKYMHSIINVLLSHKVHNSQFDELKLLYFF